MDEASKLNHIPRNLPYPEVDNAVDQWCCQNWVIPLIKGSKFLEPSYINLCTIQPFMEKCINHQNSNPCRSQSWKKAQNHEITSMDSMDRTDFNALSMLTWLSGQAFYNCWYSSWDLLAINGYFWDQVITVLILCPPHPPVMKSWFQIRFSCIADVAQPTCKSVNNWNEYQTLIYFHPLFFSIFIFTLLYRC